jgi:DegV family protein with EDD domain
VTVRVVTDSACDLPQGLADEAGVAIVPLAVRFTSAGDEATEVVERLDMTPAEFWIRATAAARVETIAPHPTSFETTYHACIAGGASGIVAICASGLLSAAVQSAQLAASAIAPLLPIHVLDSHTASAALGMIVTAVARQAARGAPIGDVVALAERLIGSSHLAVVLDPAAIPPRRTGTARSQTLMGSLLSRSPVVELGGGRISTVGTARSRGRGLRLLVRQVEAAGPLRDLAVLHTDASDTEVLDRLVTRLAPFAPRPVMVFDAGALMGSRCGHGAIGVAYLRATRR